MTKLLGIKELCEFWQSIKARLNGKVDKVAGKGLSTNDYTTAEKNKLAGIAAGAEVNVQSDWSVTDTNSDAYIKNKPSVYTKTESDNRYVNVSGDTMTGKLTLDAGLAIKSGSGQTSPPYFLCLNESYNNGGNVGYVTKANMPDALDVYTKSDSDSRYVNVTGDTMTGDLTINKATPSYLTKGTSSTRFGAAAVSSSVYAGRIHFKDSNNDIAHYIESGRNTSNETWSSFIHRRTKADGSSYTNHGFYLYIQNDGGVSVGFPSTTSRDAWATGLNVVKKAGDTMTGNLTISKSGAQLYCKSTDMDSAVGETIPSSGETMFGGIQFQDKNGYNMGWFRQYKNSNDRTYTQMLVRRHVGSSDIVNGLTLGINADGTRSVSVSESAPWRSALGVYSKTESDDRYANVSGDTFSGKAIFSGGVDIRSATHTTDPPFILTLANTFADGGNVGWIDAAELRAFSNKWTTLATAYNNTRKTFTNPKNTYAELLIVAYFPNMDDTSVSKYFTTVIPIGALSSNVLEVWVGGGRGNSTSGYANSGARAVCNLTQTYIQGVAASDGATNRISNTTWIVYAR